MVHRKKLHPGVSHVKEKKSDGINCEILEKVKKKL
jgi:hypothetical protein